MLSDHRKDVAEFKKEAAHGHDPDVKAFASKTLPTLEEHLKLASETRKAVGTSGSQAARKVGWRRVDRGLLVELDRGLLVDLETHLVRVHARIG